MGRLGAGPYAVLAGVSGDCRLRGPYLASLLHFRGGKGVATAFGAIAPIGLDLTGVMAGTWLLTILLSGYSSLGAIVSALIAPFYVWWFKPQYTFPVSMLSCLILLRHHDNIQRLWRRQESKIWTRVKKKKRQSRSNLPSRLRQPGTPLR